MESGREVEKWAEKQRCIGNLNVSYSCSFKARGHGRYPTCLPRHARRSPLLYGKDCFIGIALQGRRRKGCA